MSKEQNKQPRPMGPGGHGSVVPLKKQKISKVQ